MSGWADLGAVLAGGGNAGDMYGIKGYQAGLESANARARIDNAMLEARKARDAEIGRQALAKAAQESGDEELANFFLQGTNPASVGNFRLDRQKQGFLGDAMTLARDPNSDQNLLNREMTVIGGKPVDLTKIEGNMVLNPTVTPDSQHINPTALGDAMIGAEHALSGQRNASAEASHALAAKREGLPQLTDDDLGELMSQATAMANEGGPGAHQAEADAWLQEQVAQRGGTPGAGAVKATGLTDGQIKAMFGGDAKEYRKFLAYQHRNAQKDPRFNDARYAARAYAAGDMSDVEGGATTTAAPPPSPVEPSLGSRMMDAITNLTGGGEAAPAHVNPTEQLSGSDAARPKSKADYDALPSGALYIDPGDGQLRKKR